MRLHYELLGAGEPLMVLHGMFGSLDNWQPLNRRFASHFRVVAVDLRNHGRSPHVSEMTHEVMAADLAELLGELGLANAHVLGHSMGGKVAMRMALDHPGRVCKLVVVDASPAAQPPRHDHILQAMLALDVHHGKSRQELEESLRPAIPDLAVRRFLLKSLEPRPGGGFRWRLGLREIAESEPHLRSAVFSNRPFHGPAFFLRGELSEYLPEADLDRIRQFFPDARLATISRAGHWLHAEAPDAVYREVSAFLLDLPCPGESC